ncbi:MAG TPA: hypothetical protein VIV14_12615, partial [Gammaproteobacteria bacterium]
MLKALAEVNDEDLEIVAARYNEALRRLVMLGFLWPVRHGFESDPASTDRTPSLAAGENSDSS